MLDAKAALIIVLTASLVNVAPLRSSTSSALDTPSKLDASSNQSSPTPSPLSSPLRSLTDATLPSLTSIVAVNSPENPVTLHPYVPSPLSVHDASDFALAFSAALAAASASKSIPWISL